MKGRRSKVASREDDRYMTIKYTMRKALRKAQRKSAKQIRHKKMLEWQQRRKQGRVNSTEFNEDPSTVKRVKPTKNEQSSSLSPYGELSKQKGNDELEIEYLERKLLKNKRGLKTREDLFTTLRSEFINDGFDDDFLDFLSSINVEAGKHILENSKVHAKDIRLNNVATCSDVVEEDVVDVDLDDHDGDHYDPAGENVHLSSNVEKRVRFDIPTTKKSKGNDKTVATKLMSSDSRASFPKISLEELKRSQIGMINRISEGNFTIVAKELISMYNNLLSTDDKLEHADHRLKIVDDLIDDLCKCTIKMVIENEGTVISLVALHTALICVLCNMIGINVGYVYCYGLFKTMEWVLPVLFKNEGNMLSEAKLVLRNCVMSFAVMSHFEMLGIETIFFLIKNISREEITDYIAQVLLILLRYTVKQGHKMKAESPSSFLKTMDHFNKLLDDYKAKHGDLDQSRLRFFKEEIQGFKMSKERKPFETFEFLKHHLKGQFRYQGDVTNPQVDHQVLLKFNQLYGSSNMSSHTILENLKTSSLVSVKTARMYDHASIENLLQKASALRLYSNCQKSTFVALMGAIDPNHAVERIMDIGFKATQYNEVVYTIVHCLMCEKLYNEFYTAVAMKLARLPSVTGKRFTRANVCTIIASIEYLQEKKLRKCAHLGRFLASMVIGKVIEFKLVRFIKKEHIATPSVISFLKNLFGHLVTHTIADSEEHVIEQLMSILHEDIFDLLCELWYEYLQDYCTEKVVSGNHERIIMEACRRIFGNKSNA